MQKAKKNRKDGSDILQRTSAVGKMAQETKSKRKNARQKLTEEENAPRRKTLQKVRVKISKNKMQRAKCNIN